MERGKKEPNTPTLLNSCSYPHTQRTVLNVLTTNDNLLIAASCWDVWDRDVVNDGTV